MLTTQQGELLDTGWENSLKMLESIVNNQDMPPTHRIEAAKVIFAEKCGKVSAVSAWPAK